MNPYINCLRKAAIPILSLAYYSQLYRVIGSWYGGCGVIFNMHRVLEPGHRTLYPGHIIHADVLDRLLHEVKMLGWETIGIDDVYARLSSGILQTRGNNRVSSRFACFTSDDGYGDNLTQALPVFRRHKAPICVYITTGQVERSIFYWVGANEELVLKSERIDLPAIGNAAPMTMITRNPAQKRHAYLMLNGFCHTVGDDFFPVLRDLYRKHGVDAQGLLDRDALTIAQARELASDPLVTIGCHSLTHRRLSSLTSAEVCTELQEGRRILESWLAVKVQHLSYPYGRRDACGPREFTIAKQSAFKTAVTSRQGNIFPAHSDYLECLPRRSIPLSLFKLRSVLFGVETIIQKHHKFQTN